MASAITCVGGSSGFESLSDERRAPTELMVRLVLPDVSLVGRDRLARRDNRVAPDDLLQVCDFPTIEILVDEDQKGWGVAVSFLTTALARHHDVLGRPGLARRLVVN